MIDILIADDHPVVRTGLKALIDSQPDMRVLDEVGTAEDLIARVREGTTAHVLLVDLRFGDGRMSGAEATAQIVALGGPPVLILTTYDTDTDILTAIEAGATGYLLKDSPTEELTSAIRSAAAGEVAFGAEVQRRLIGRLRHPTISLSLREIQVLAQVADGASNDQIAATLILSRATVKTHLAHIYDKLGVSNRTEAVTVARQRGILY